MKACELQPPGQHAVFLPQHFLKEMLLLNAGHTALLLQSQQIPPLNEFPVNQAADEGLFRG
jgi:hypothetical protein